MSHPHDGQPVLTAGASLEDARAAMLLIHGRGAGARGILGLAHELQAEGLTYLAPNAYANTWYPQRFIMPLEANEPYLSSALKVVESLVQRVMAASIRPEKIMLLGFSQGACLALEYIARHPRRYGGAIAFSGGLIGQTLDPARYSGSLEETPVFIGCSDDDFHIPLERVHESTAQLQQMGAAVTERIYPGMGHTINQDELDHARQMVKALK